MSSPKTITLRLPWPPSANHYYVNINYRGRLMRVIGAEGKKYQKAVACILMDMDSPRLDGNLRVDELVLHPPDRARRDIDNVFKCLWDSLQDRKDKNGIVLPGLFHDDWQIREQNHIRWGEPVPDGRVVLTISEMPGSLFEGQP